MRVLAIALTWLMCAAATAQEPALQPGLYEISFTLELPNVVTTGIGPTMLHRCISDADVRSGSAFAVLGENPIRACPLQDYSIAGGKAVYRIVCPGANAPFANAVFDLSRNAYRGVISMNMGGKNMTMSERQRGKRLGACP
jgi:uncharacterized protein DUF3617